MQFNNINELKQHYEKQHRHEFFQERIAIAVESGVHIKQANSQAVKDWEIVLKDFLKKSERFLILEALPLDTPKHFD